MEKENKSKIKLLSESTINKIAAGEVIERPASVIKELVENSIDAGASEIVVRIKDGGKKLIQIKDNGSGIDDVELAIMRHSTSKIEDENDLYRIETLGFRGEALASITEISKTNILTKTKNDECAYEININGGRIVSHQKFAREIGTTITVKDLFYNTPVRKNYLKKKEVERRHCIEAVTKLGLSKDYISIKLISDDKEIINMNGQKNSFQNKFINVLGKETTKSLFEITNKEEPHEIFKINGFLAKPYFVRNDKDKEFVFVNGRAVRCKIVEEAIHDAFHTMLFLDKHPIFIIYIDIDTTKIDINVHPTKYEIRIENENELYQEIIKVCKEAFVKNSLIPEVEIQGETNLKNIKKVLSKNQENYEQKTLEGEEGSKEKNQNYVLDENRKEESNYYRDEEKPSIIVEKIIKESKNSEINTYNKEETEELAESQISKTEYEIKKHDFGITKILGQIKRLYILAETNNGLIVIDQHAAEEKVLFEEFLKQFKDKKVDTQEMLGAQIIEVTEKELEIFEEYEEVLKNMGFIVELFSQNELRVRAVPEIFGKIKDNFFLETLHQLSKISKGMERDVVENKIASMACRAAIKSGDELTLPQMKKLVERLENIDKPFSCPHGRPTMINISYNEFEKKFKRIT